MARNIITHIQFSDPLDRRQGKRRAAGRRNEERRNRERRRQERRALDRRGPERRGPGSRTSWPGQGGLLSDEEREDMRRLVEELLKD